MKHLLSLIFIMIFNFSAFGQIDTIEWNATTIWIKSYVLGERCCSENYSIWGLFAQFDIRNPHTNEIDEYILIKEDGDTFLQNLPNLYTKAVDFDISEKKILVDDFQKNVPEIEIALIKRFGNLDNVYFFDDYVADDLTNDWVYVLPISLSKISLIDLKTSRVIEKIELEKPKPKILFYLEDLADSAWYQQWSNGYEYLFTQDTFYRNQPKYISKDTILVIEKKTFVKELVGVNCESLIEDCLFWGLHLKYNISNSMTGQFDEYIIIKDDSVEVFSRFIRSIPTLHEQSKKVDLSNRNFFVDDLQSNSARIEAALLKILGSLDDVSFYPVLYRKEHLTDKWIYVCVEDLEYIKLVDLKTNRVIGKIELEPK